MRKYLNRLSAFVLALCLFWSVCAPASTVFAASGEIRAFSVCFTSADAELDQINWFRRDGQYYLFVPSEADLSKTIVHFTATDTVSLRYTDNGAAREVTLADGETTDVFSHKAELHRGSFTAICGGREYPITLLQSTNLPSIYINLDQPLSFIHQSKENKAGGDFKLVKADGTVDAARDLKQFKGRGNATWELEKKPYNIKFKEAVDLLGMGAAKGWCLIANYTDRSQARNELAYGLGLDGGIDFCSQSNAVNLYVNQDYLGVYSLTEKVDIGENNVDITDLEKATEKLNDKDLDAYTRAGRLNTSEPGDQKWVSIPVDPDDITGGYLLEFDLSDRYRAEPCGFVTKKGQPVVSKYPEYASKRQINYISSFVQDLEDAAYSSTGFNAKGRHYSEYIDIPSLAKMYVLQELGANLDNVITSFFLYKDSDNTGDGKLHFAPAWDFDNAFAGSTGRYGVNLTDPNVVWTDRGILYESERDPNDITTGTPHLMNVLYNQKDHLLLDEIRYQWFNVFAPLAQDRLTGTSPKSFTAMYTYKTVAVSMLDATRWNYSGNDFKNNLDVVENYLRARVSFFNKKFRSTDANAFVVSGIEPVVYHGSSTTLPALTVKNCTGGLLEENKDYRLTYQDNATVGRATVTIEGIGAYSGSRSFAFDVVTADISDYPLAPIPDAVYTGNEITPAVRFAAPYDVLQPELDYTVTYQNNRKAGTATVTVAGVGNTTGSQTVSFRILPAQVSALRVSRIPIKTYRGKKLLPSPEVTFDGQPLKAGVDYTLRYKNNSKVGTATVTVIGVGSFTGQQSVSFTIRPQKVKKVRLTAGKKQLRVTVKRVVGAKKYEITYAKNRRFKHAKTRRIAGLRTTLKKLRAKTTYYVKVRAVSGGVRGSYSKIYRIKIK